VCKNGLERTFLRRTEGLVGSDALTKGCDDTSTENGRNNADEDSHSTLVVVD
jgi:hypothetical protein